MSLASIHFTKLGMYRPDFHRQRQHTWNGNCFTCSNDLPEEKIKSTALHLCEE